MNRKEMLDLNFKCQAMPKLSDEVFNEIIKRQVEMDKALRDYCNKGSGALFFDLDVVLRVSPFLSVKESLLNFIKDNAPESEYIGKVNLVVNFSDDCKNKRDRNSFFVNHPLFSSRAIVMKARQCGRSLMTKQMMDTGLGTIREMDLLERNVCKWMDSNRYT